MSNPKLAIPLVRYWHMQCQLLHLDPTVSSNGTVVITTSTPKLCQINVLRTVMPYEYYTLSK